MGYTLRHRKAWTIKRAVGGEVVMGGESVVITESKGVKTDNKKRISRVGTWNIRSLNGKEVELINEFERAGLEILVIPETKKKGKGTLGMEGGHLLLWSGVEKTERAQAGIGCILNKDVKEKMNSWEPISERILKVELKYRASVKTIIAVYGPSEDEKVEKKDRFWEDLSLAVEAARGEIIVAGDINGRVGKADQTYTVIGKHGEEARNNNGKRLLDFCTTYDMIVANTFYQHRDIHKYTRVEANRGERSIIDYILVERQNRSMIRDVAVKRGYEINSDHYLVVAEIKSKQEENGKHVQKEGRVHIETIKKYKLKDRRVAQKYEEKVSEEVGRVAEEAKRMSIEEIWEVFKAIILQSAKTTCGTYKSDNHRKQTAWWTEEIKQQVKVKKKRWQKYLSNKNEADYQSYKEQRLKVKDLVMKSKQKTWKEFGEKLEKDSRGNQKLFYRVLKNLRDKKEVDNPAIKNEKGEILRNQTEIMNRWKEYFQKLLEAGDETEILEQGEECEMEEQGILREEEDMIAREELIEALSELKNGKAPGNDKITGEMMKNMGEKGVQMLLDIFNRVWQEEIIPEDWKIGLIVPIFKKGDNKDCNNYRGITLLNTATKVFEKIIEKRLRKEVEPTLTEAQSGFRKGRCTQDHIFTIKEIMNRRLAVNKRVYLAYIDLEKAFDKVPRKKIWECLNERGISKKLIRITKCLYKDTKNKVISKNAMSEEFNTTEGVRQGGSLSPLLFITYMDKIIRETQRRTKPLHIGYKNLEIVDITECAFADDIALITGSEGDLEENLRIWNEVLIKNGMKINRAKTKVMVAANERKEVNIILDNERIEQVSSFQYLGVTLEETGKHEIEIGNRIKKANNVYWALRRGFINKKEITKETKMKVYKTIYRPVLTYGCETWTMTGQEKDKIGAVEMKYLRRVKGVTRRDRIRNEVIRGELETESVGEYIEQKQLAWWGHLQRMSNATQVKKIWESKTQGKRKRGRPKQTWDSVVGREISKRGKTWTEARGIAQDRKEWKRFIEI